MDFDHALGEQKGRLRTLLCTLSQVSLSDLAPFCHKLSSHMCFVHFGLSSYNLKVIHF